MYGRMNLMQTMQSFFILQLLFLLSSLTNHATQAYHTYECSTSDNYTSTGSFLSNLKQLLYTLPSNAVKNDWFFNNTVGQAPNQVYGLAMCHYYTSNTQACTSCLTEAANNITIDCPYSTTAILWLSDCFVRYSNQNFFSNYQADDVFYSLRNRNNASDEDTFKQVVDDLMAKLNTDVATSPKLLAVGEANYTTNIKIYGLVECTRDLLARECQMCVSKEIEYISFSCLPSIGCHKFGRSCSIRYEVYPFYNPISSPPVPSPVPSPAIPSPPPQPINSQGKTQSVIVTIIIVVGCATAFLLVISGVYLCMRITKRMTVVESSMSIAEPSFPRGVENLVFDRGAELLVFDFNTMKEATSNFSEKNKLGEGGFGEVFKGRLQNGQEIAVKRLSSTSFQGMAELKNEVEFLGRTKHRNLVQVVGYCLQEKEKILCYEYLHNGSLDMILFATDAVKRRVLDWKTRFNIIDGISRGLVYLHVESGATIIHRDLKASNILLDKSMNPKISDFGLARLFAGDKTHKSTVHIAGTFGYIAPEYLMHLTFSPKSDVFSFGVLILEIVTGRKCSTGLISYVWQQWREGKKIELKDPTLLETNTEQVIKCIHIGLLCVQERPEQRPNITDVNFMLHGHPSSLPLVPSGKFIWSAQVSSIYEEISCSTSSANTNDEFPRQFIHTR